MMEAKGKKEASIIKTKERRNWHDLENSKAVVIGQQKNRNQAQKIGDSKKEEEEELVVDQEEDGAGSEIEAMVETIVVVMYVKNNKMYLQIFVLQKVACILTKSNLLSTL